MPEFNKPSFAGVGVDKTSAAWNEIHGTLAALEERRRSILRANPTFNQDQDQEILMAAEEQEQDSSVDAIQRAAVIEIPSSAALSLDKADEVSKILDQILKSNEEAMKIVEEDKRNSADFNTVLEDYDQHMADWKTEVETKKALGNAKLEERKETFDEAEQNRKLKIICGVISVSVASAAAVIIFKLYTIFSSQP